MGAWYLLTVRHFQRECKENGRNLITSPDKCKEFRRNLYTNGGIRPAISGRGFAITDPEKVLELQNMI